MFACVRVCETADEDSRRGERKILCGQDACCVQKFQAGKQFMQLCIPFLVFKIECRKCLHAPQIYRERESGGVKKRNKKKRKREKERET